MMSDRREGRYAQAMASTTDRSGIEVEPQQLARWLGHGSRPEGIGDDTLPEGIGGDTLPDEQGGQSLPEVIDVREPHEHEAGHIAGTSLIPLAELSSAAGRLARDKPVIFYCRSGARSMMAAQAFRKAGLDAYTMKGGLLRWVTEGLPITPEGGVVADH